MNVELVRRLRHRHAIVVSDGSQFGHALDSILGMSVQLPFMKKIGDEIGLDFDAQLAKDEEATAAVLKDIGLVK